MQPELTGENEESPQRSLAPLKVPDVGEFFHSRTGGIPDSPNMWRAHWVAVPTCGTFGSFQEAPPHRGMRRSALAAYFIG